MDTLRAHAAAERIRGRYVDWRRRRRGVRPSALTISNWYFSTAEDERKTLGWGKLELTVTSQVAQGKGRLALNLETRAIHKLDEVLNKLRLALGKFLPI
jgi:hypothetical protein